jgi:ketosteroid isomerase-like protein
MRRATLIALAACVHAATFTTADDRAVRDTLAAQAQAWNRGDLDGYMAGYARSPELVFTSGGKIRRGWQQAYDSYRAKYGSDRSTMGKLAFEVLAVQPLGADGAVVLGTWRLALAGGAVGGVFSVVFARTPDGWRVIHDHTSLEAP